MKATEENAISLIELGCMKFDNREECNKMIRLFNTQSRRMLVRAVVDNTIVLL